MNFQFLIFKLIKKSTKNGFTLLEVMLAIFFITVGIGGAFAVIQRSFTITSMNSSRIIAANLTQEGIEIVRNIRDTNWLDPLNPGWADGLSIGNYEADYTNTDLISLACSPCDYEHLNFLNIDGNDFYSYSGGSVTKFKRKIFISNCSPPDPNCLRVLVDVMWREREREHSFWAQEILWNWK